MKTTVFITCLMTVTRTLSLLRPLAQTSTRSVLLSLVLFLLYQLILVTLAFSTTIPFTVYWLELATLPTALTIVIIISCVISTACLLKSKPVNITSDTRRKRNVHASVTVLILAVLFCVFNIPFCVVHIWEVHLGPGSLYGSVHNYSVYVFTYSLCVPLNSAINPVIYFIRNKKLRLFLINKLCCRDTTATVRSTLYLSDGSGGRRRHPGPNKIVYVNRNLVVQEQIEEEQKVGRDRGEDRQKERNLGIVSNLTADVKI